MTFASLTASGAPLVPRRLAKPKMLVVDDEPDNLDLLQRTFRREFEVLRAESGKAALATLAQEGEVAVIISDQRMPEMKGTEFLSRTVPQFPDTVRIILTGFTDVEDLVEAINAGQVHRYITKPWDAEELKQVVERATETYGLLKQRADHLNQAQTQARLLSQITEIAQTAERFETALPAIAAAFAKTFEADSCTLQQVTSGSLVGAVGGAGAVDIDSFARDSLVKAAIEQRAIQAVRPAVDIDFLEGPSVAGLYSSLVTPVLYRDQVVAVLALQWRSLYSLSEAYHRMLTLAVGHLALALVCLQV